jgi:tetratricopeptide (TPR) repeat protein
VSVERQRKSASIPVGNVVKHIGTLRTLRRNDEALRLGLDTLHQLTEAGIAGPMWSVLAAVAPAARSNARVLERAWLDNYRSVAASLDGDNAGAEKYLRRGLETAKRVRDPAIHIALLMNLGVRRHDAGDVLEADRFYKRALRKSLDAKQYEISTKLLLNRASIATHRKERARAEALLATVAQVLSAVPDPGLLASWHFAKGELAVVNGDLQAAQNEFRIGIRYSRRGGRSLLQAVLMQSLGAALIETNQLRQGADWLRKADHLAAKIGSARTRIVALRSLAVALDRLKRRRETRGVLQKARALSEATGNDRQWAETTMDLAALSSAMGRLKEAIRLLLECWPRVSRMDDTALAVRTARSLVRLAGLMGDQAAVRTAVQLSESIRLDALARADVMSDGAQWWLVAGGNPRIAVQWINTALSRLAHKTQSLTLGREAAEAGALFREFDVLEASVRFFKKARRAYEVAGATDLALNVRNDFALVLARRGLLSEAREELVNSLKEAQRTRNRAAMLLVTPNLAEVMRRLGKPGEAVRLLRRAERTRLTLGNEPRQAWVKNLLGLAESDLGQLDEASASFKEALTAARRTKDTSAQADAWGGLAGINYRRKEYSIATHLYQRAAKIRGRTDREGTVHLVEDLGGALESASRSGRATTTERIANELIKVGQAQHLESQAGWSLANAGRSWLERGNTTIGVDLFAASIGILGTATDPTGQTTVRGVITVVAHIEQVMGQSKSDAVYTALSKSFERLHKGLGRAVEPTIRDAAKRLRQREAQGQPARQTYRRFASPSIK